MGVLVILCHMFRLSGVSCSTKLSDFRSFVID